MCQCYIPPYILENLAKCPDPFIRQKALDALQASAESRALRRALGTSVTNELSFVPRSTGCNRYIYDMNNQMAPLPGRLIRKEGEMDTQDKAANEAYLHSGIVYDFYKNICGRNSIDNRGMAMVSSVHLGKSYNNAFWSSNQMAYGDGDGQTFLRLTRALDVAGHEITHGVISYECNLEYEGEPGALNESFADVMGAIIEHWHNKISDPAKANWDMGELIMGSSPAKRLRTFKEEKAYVNDPYLGTDPQPKHYKNKYTGDSDHGGVHINSGIPNHAFYKIALLLGTPTWEKPGKIWYQTIRNLNSQSSFIEMAHMTYQVGGNLYGAKEQEAIRQGWHEVGIVI
ncbi:M4 family metallopeptidase [Spirochaeta cellobiosiphila]|uniref:M4 family metallopeptidase n=1 Tax=Spirochaeta cellobiosiphila TaxID=504483 RepID=UPI0004082582|nr:M4 family metallopeptidase [Spirochaeta cellobiosiphila]